MKARVTVTLKNGKSVSREFAYPKGDPRLPLSDGELAEKLQSKHHSVVALIDRCEKLSLIERRQSLNDRRQVNIHLLPAGERCLAKLAELHRQELLTLNNIFKVPTINS